MYFRCRVDVKQTHTRPSFLAVLMLYESRYVAFMKLTSGAFCVTALAVVKSSTVDSETILNINI